MAEEDFVLNGQIHWWNNC